MRPERCSPSDHRRRCRSSPARAARRSARAGRPRSPSTARSRTRARSSGIVDSIAPDRGEAEQPLEVAVLEDPDEHARGGPERDDVEQQRLDGHDDRPGHEEQQHERGEHDEADGDTAPAAHRGVEVRQRRSLAGRPRLGNGGRSARTAVTTARASSPVGPVAVRRPTATTSADTGGGGSTAGRRRAGRGPCGPSRHLRRARRGRRR